MYTESTTYNLTVASEVDCSVWWDFSENQVELLHHRSRMEKISFISFPFPLVRVQPQAASIPLSLSVAWLLAEQVPPELRPQWPWGNPGVGLRVQARHCQTAVAATVEDQNGHCAGAVHAVGSSWSAR